MLEFGLNQITIPKLPFGGFLRSAVSLGRVGVELRNDLGRPLFNGSSAKEAGSRVRGQGLRILGLSQVYPCNRWASETENEVRSLIETAVLSGAETISLIPCNDGTGTGETTRVEGLTFALERCVPMLKEAGIVALVEPLGFDSASMRFKSEVVEIIDALQASDAIKLVHDTFHHSLVGGGPIYPAQTGIVHISGVTAELPFGQMQDEDRGLVGPVDRLDNIGQIRALLEAGYAGVFSFECFAPEVHGLADPVGAVKQSIDFISSQIQQRAA